MSKHSPEGREIPKDSIIITDLEAFAPEKILGNKQLEEELKDTEWGEKHVKDKTVDDPIYEQRVGIKERRISSDEEGSTDLAEEAGRKLIEKSPLNPNESTIVLVGTLTAENRTPSVAAELMFRLDITEKHGFDEISGHDLGAACSGWTYGIYDAKAALVSGDFLVALVFSTDTMSKFLKPESRERILFGDAATAAKLKKETEGDKGFRIKGTYKGIYPVDSTDVRIQTRIAPELVPNEFDTDEEKKQKAEQAENFQIEAGRVYDSGVAYSTKFIQKYLDKNNLTLEDFDYVIPHQANGRMLNALEENLNFGTNKYGQTKMLKNIESFGNTAASSIPLALYDFKEDGKFKDGDRILTCSFGAGYTLGIVDVEYVE